MPIPTRPHGGALGNTNNRLPKDTPIIGLGCSSFSTFFWTSDQLKKEDSSTTSSDDDMSSSQWAAENLDKKHPIVKEWISTIKYAVEDCGITLLDTAPWYGHGTSEVIIGWAMEEILHSNKTKNVDRKDMIINTKIGRYEADPQKQFDFGKDATLASAKRSIERMKCQYIDVLQLHDPEFAPSLEQIMKETIPALLECREKGYCKALGITGYPLKTQYQILQRSLELDATSGPIWDQSLTYGHYNLANTSLMDEPIQESKSFYDYCRQNNVGVMAAAPLNMGLFTQSTLADWHPATPDLKEACQKAISICVDHSVDITTLAIAFALSNPQLPCTLLGMKNKEEVRYSYELACRFQDVKATGQEEILKEVLKEDEFKAFEKVRDPMEGPFAKLWRDGNFAWDGVTEAKKFWESVEGQEQENWHMK